MIQRLSVISRIAIPLVVLMGLGFGGYLLLTKHRILPTFSTPRKRVKVRKKGEGSVHIISSASEWENIYPQLIQDTQTIKVVGLDCEWVFEEYIRHPVALLQISTQQGLCLLVRLCHMSNRIPHSLKHFLTDKRILKVGVSVKDDGKKLYRDYGLPVNGCIDLRFLLPRVPNIYICKTKGLQGLAEGILGVDLDKDDSVRCGNWEADTLDEQQIQYGAADAVVAVDIFTKLVLSKILGRVPDPLYPPGSNSVGEEEFWTAATELSQGIMDHPYHIHRAIGTKTEGNKQTVKTVEAGEGGSRAYSPRQRPLNFNCQLQSPSGKMLRRCDILRAEWYLKKNLGRKVSDDPYIVQLRYKPQQTNVDEDFDELYEKHADAEGMCVVCGRTDAFIRKFVIPTEYRKFFHRVLKSARRSHNIVIMCPDCYHISSQHDAILRQRLAQECNAPLDSGAGSKSVKDRDLQKIQAAAKALKFNRDKIPAKRVTELENTLKDFYGVTSLYTEVIEMALDMDVKVMNVSYVPHGKLVVQHYKQKDGLYEFEKMWRKHFLDTMEPKYLPPFWLVDFRNIRVEPEESQHSSEDEEN